MGVVFRRKRKRVSISTYHEHFMQQLILRDQNDLERTPLRRLQLQVASLLESFLESSSFVSKFLESLCL